MWHKNQGTFLIYLQCWLSPNSHPLMHPLLQTIGQWIDALKMDLTKAELLASRWAATTINLCHWGICKEADWEEEPNSFCSLFSLLLLFDVWSLLGAWTLRLFGICHVPLICKLQEKAIHGLISHANTSNTSDICSGVPSNTDIAKHVAGWAEAWGLSSCPQVRAFVPRAQLSHWWLFVCVPNTQCLPFSGTKENRRWHEVSTFSLVNWTAQPEIQVLNFQQQTKGSCSSPVHWNQVTFISASNPGSVCLLILPYQHG